MNPKLVLPTIAIFAIVLSIAVLLVLYIRPTYIEPHLQPIIDEIQNKPTATPAICYKTLPNDAYGYILQNGCWIRQ